MDERSEEGRGCCIGTRTVAVAAPGGGARPREGSNDQTADLRRDRALRAHAAPVFGEVVKTD